MIGIKQWGTWTVCSDWESRMCDYDCFNCKYPDCVNDEMPRKKRDLLDCTFRDEDTQVERRVKTARKYYYTHRDIVLARAKAKRDANKEKANAKQRAYRAKRAANGFT